jgi:UDP-sugar transporter A1/2/3
VSTALLMRFVLSHKLTWTQVKALVLLVCGSIVTQLQPASQPSRENKQWDFVLIGYVAVCVNSLAAGLGGVYSDMLLMGNATGCNESIHWQNCQLYFFGVVFGLVSILTQTGDKLGSIYDGFNGAAIGTVVALATTGLLVSFVLKYLDNFAKCFVNALSMIVVGVAHALTSRDGMQLPLIIGIVLTSIAIEQYSLS